MAVTLHSECSGREVVRVRLPPAALRLIQHTDMSRLKAILKLARGTLTIAERLQLNEALSGAKGFDYINHILKGFGFSIGTKIRKNKFHLRRDGEPIGNAVLKGDYEGMQVFPQESIEEVEEDQPKIPWDAYHSPGAIYDEWERRNEK
jgi:hypothetical protein